VVVAEQLRHAAEAACAHSQEVMEAVLRRRSSQPKPTRETMERIERTAMRLEMARSRREMRGADLETVRRMRLEEREAVKLERWIRSQAASMLADGWTPEELADIGIDARYATDPSPPEDGAPR
jgi:hypothetical protein